MYLYKKLVAVVSGVREVQLFLIKFLRNGTLKDDCCYYGFEDTAAKDSCKNNNIPIADFQHGPLGLHMAYLL
jgi:hypothetical protein